MGLGVSPRRAVGPSAACGNRREREREREREGGKDRERVCVSFGKRMQAARGGRKFTA